MSTNNPDFSFESKKLIARATRKVLGIPTNNMDQPRPANPAAGGGDESPPEIAGQIRVAGANGVATWSEAPLVDLD
jgi:hypothetical protein